MVDLGEDHPATIDKGLSKFCRRHASAAPDEERGTNRFLQILQQLGGRGLRKVKCARRMQDAAVLNQCNR
ncbi:hypothetical protein M5C90_14320 [Pseudomonas chlororaphis subsp. piscium]|nr:hypothetical protein M5C90_14320 [Pseudomonas chlororaphis subsp. piscium]